MRIAFHTLGCKQNYAESSHIRGQFEAKGFEIVEFGQDCDAVIINTCSVTDSADVECRKIVRRAIRSSPNAFVGVTGCYAQLHPEEIASIDGVDAVFGAHQKFRIPEIVRDFRKRSVPQVFVDDVDGLEFVESIYSENDARTRAFLKIQDGCDYNCSFCTIPRARGASRSMDPHRIVDEVERLAALGYQEVVVTGINLGEYCGPNGERFAQIVEQLDRRDSGIRIRISSCEPNKLHDDIIDRVAESSVFCRHFHIPLQSGSDTILRSMRRRYNTRQYAQLIERIACRIPDVGLGADVISGFPGETDETHHETLSFLRSLPLSYLHIFTYSEREHTDAASYEHAVPVEVRRRRTRELRQVSEQKKTHFALGQIGKEASVVPENYHLADGQRAGYSDNYIRVQYQPDRILPERLTRIRFVNWTGEYCQAEQVESHQHTLFPLYVPLIS